MLMKPSSTDKFIALTLFALTIFHTTSHFTAQAEEQYHHSNNALTQTHQKSVQVYGQDIQIGWNKDVAARTISKVHSNGVHTALSTGSDCLPDAWVVNQQ